MLAGLLLFAATVPALRVPGPLSPRAASYAIEARLDEVTHKIAGKERIRWKNTVGGAPTTLVLHLYLEAFKNEDSVYFRERHHENELDEHGWSGVELHHVLVGGRDVVDEVRREGTLATVPLAAPLSVGETVEIEVEWTARLPPVYERTGWMDSFHMGAQWFPKAAVWQCAKGGATCDWHADEYHPHSEFFADWGVYDVTLDVAANAQVAATGVRVKEEPREGGRKRVTFHAEDVHDFAFAVDPRFTVIEDELVDAWGKVRIVAYMLPGHESVGPRHLRAAKDALEELQRRFGVYPYGQITIVDVPDGGEEAGGMEYPTLVTTLSPSLPRGLHFAELVTVHEVGHQYFHGIVGSDEACEPWLDEGLNETFEGLSLERVYGKRDSIYRLLGRSLSSMGMARIEVGSSGHTTAVASTSWAFPEDRDYGNTVYAATALTMRTVEGYIGRARFEAGWRRYVDRWRFRHPTTDDFIAAFDEGAGVDLSWFWGPALRQAGVLDYEVRSIVVHPHQTAAGLYDCPKKGELPAGCTEDDRGKRVELDVDAKGEENESDVLVRRLGDIVFPVTLEVTFADGTRQREQWDGRDRWHRFTYRRTSKLATAEIDPDHLVALDLNTFNNSLRAKNDARASRRVGSFWSFLLATLWQAL